MEKVLFIALMVGFASCSTSNSSSTTAQLSNSTEQVFIENQTKGLPRKCYQQMILENQKVWTEVLCDSQINKNLIRQIQGDLGRLFFILDVNEVANAKLGSTTKKAIKDFQFRHNMAHGGLDWATINRLKAA